MTFTETGHITNEAIELYAMEKLSAAEEVRVEEHLLLCANCQKQLQETDDFLHAFRIAAPRVEAEEAARMEEPWWQRFLSWFPRIQLMHAAGVVAALVVAVVLIAPRTREASGTAELTLTAMRDGDPGAAATMSAGQSLDMKLDLTGLQAEARYAVEVADGRGNALWRSEAAPDAGILHLRMEQPLKSGDHWVRIYRLRDREMLREFAVRVR